VRSQLACGVPTVGRQDTSLTWATARHRDNSGEVWHLDSTNGLEVNVLSPVAEGVRLALPLETLSIDVGLSVVVEELEFDVLSLTGLDHDVELIGILDKVLGGNSSVLIGSTCLVDDGLESPVRKG